MTSLKNRGQKIVVGITGASGSILGQRLVGHLLELGQQVHLIISRDGVEVFAEEVGVFLGKDHETIQRNLLSHFQVQKRGLSGQLVVHPHDDFAAKVSSGSAKMDAMVIAPCSMSTVGAIANGITMNLIHRAAGVFLKEKRPLVVVWRESPLSLIHLKNLTALSEAGAHIVPATTAFYHKPKTVVEMVDFTVGRVLDLLKIENDLFKRWKGSLES